MYTNEEISFILYNNRSVNGVVVNFLPKDIDGYKLVKLEEKLEWCKSLYQNDQKFVEINKNELDLGGDDINVYKEDISKLTDIVLQSHYDLSGVEYEYLINRGISDSIILEYKLGGLSNIKNKEDLVKLNATCHPLLSPILEDGIEGGGIIIPLFDNNNLLVNCAIRKISDIGKLKYSLACPDIPVWGLNDIENEEIWICEGLFDMMALRSCGKKAVSVSSAMWSGPQLYQLLEKKPSKINILSDNDQVGMRTSVILQKFFNINSINNETYLCPSSKDAAEHIFEKRMSVDDIKECKITKDMILKEDQSFNFLKYLKNRQF